MRPLTVLLVLLVLVPLAMAGAIYGLFLLWGRDLPAPQSPKEVEAPRKTRRCWTGTARSSEEFFIENRSPRPLAQIPELLRQAVLATEDRRFGQHWGVDLPGVLRAVLSNFAAREASARARARSRSSSPATLFLSQSQTLERKIKEAILAVRLERSFSKEEILEFYLNRIYFGEGAYGVEAAAQRFFGKVVHRAHARGSGAARRPAGQSRRPTPPCAIRRRPCARRNSVLRRMEDAGGSSTGARAWRRRRTPLALSRGPARRIAGRLLRRDGAASS